MSHTTNDEEESERIHTNTKKIEEEERGESITVTINTDNTNFQSNESGAHKYPFSDKATLVKNLSLD